MDRYLLPLVILGLMGVVVQCQYWEKLYHVPVSWGKDVNSKPKVSFLLNGNCFEIIRSLWSGDICAHCKSWGLWPVMHSFTVFQDSSPLLLGKTWEFFCIANMEKPWVEPSWHHVPLPSTEWVKWVLTMSLLVSTCLESTVSESSMQWNLTWESFSGESP